MFRKIILSLLITTGFAAQGMDNARNYEKTLFESFDKDNQKATKKINDQKAGYNTLDTVLKKNHPSTEDDTIQQLKLGQSPLFIVHRSKL